MTTTFVHLFLLFRFLILHGKHVAILIHCRFLHGLVFINLPVLLPRALQCILVLALRNECELLLILFLADEYALDTTKYTLEDAFLLTFMLNGWSALNLIIVMMLIRNSHSLVSLSGVIRVVKLE